MIAQIRGLFLMALGFGLVGVALAGSTLSCEPEPTDMSISYGDFINCDISPAGDSDYYRAHFNIGDAVQIDLTDTGVGDVWLLVFDPTGQLIHSLSSSTTQIFNEIISTAGTHTVIAKALTPSNIGAYSLYLTCVGGPCISGLPQDVTAGGGISISGAYVKLDFTNGLAPPASDCQDDSHYGRMVLDDVNSILYVCSQSGWTTH